MKEIVLQSGRFARVRPITWGDFVRSHDNDYHRWVMKLATLVVRIDDVDLTIDAACEMPLGEAIPLLLLVSSELSSALGSKAVS